MSAIPLASQITSSTSEIKPSDLDLILQRIEDARHQNLSQSQPYKVTRKYKVFRGYDRRPTPEVIAQIDFVPPDVKTYKTVETRGNSWGAKIVRELLSSETSSTRKEHSTEIIIIRRAWKSQIPCSIRWELRWAQRKHCLVIPRQG